MSDSNYASVGYVKETSFGNTPSTPSLQALRLVSETLTRDKDTIISNEVRPDRQTSDLVEVGSAASGGLEFELSYTSLKPWLTAALFGAVSVIDLTGVDCDIVQNVAAIIASSETFDSVPVGATVKIEGATNPANNGYKMVVSKESGRLNFPPNTFAADEASATLAFSGTNVKNGLNRETFTLERRILTSNATPADRDYYQTFLGMAVDTLSLNFESKQIVTGSLGFMGKNGGSSESSISTGVDHETGYTAADSNPVMNATSNLANFLFQQEAATEKLKTISLNIANGLRGKDAIGENGNFDLGVGSFEVTGSLSGYFLNNALYDLIISHGNVALSWQVFDSLGNRIVFTLPRIKLANGTPQIGGKNTDIMTSADFTAILDETTKATMIIDFHAAPTV